MGKMVPVTLTEQTFINGALFPAGTTTMVDSDTIGGGLGDDTPNLAKPVKGAVPVPYEVASIAPTGPNPVIPQSLPPGSLPAGTTFLAPGSEGGPAVQPVAEGTTDDGTITRRS